ncbi:MAG: ABC transporter permease [Planctomycetota bacterium]
MRFWQLVLQALDSVRRSPLRSSLTVLGVAVAAGALVSMVGFALGLQAQAEAPFEKLGLLNNIEVRAGKVPSGNPQDLPLSPLLDDAALERLEALSGVACVYPDFRLSELQVWRGESSRTAYAMGLPREAALVGLFEELLVAGRFFTLSGGSEALLGTRLATKLGFAEPESAIGVELRLVAEGLAAEGAETFRLRREERRVAVVGVFEPPGFASDLGGDGLLLPVDLMRGMAGLELEGDIQRLRPRDGTLAGDYARAIVRAESVADVPRVEEEIRKLGFSTRALVSQLEEMRAFFLFMDVLLAAVGTVALVVAGLGILNTLLMTVLERRQEIGIYKAIGASNGDVRVIFLAEAALLGLFGGLGGLLLARLVSWLLQLGVDAYLRHEGLEIAVAVFSFPCWLLSVAVVFAIFMSVLSGLMPASRAASIDPIRALR